MAEVIIVRDAAEAGAMVADALATLITANPATVLGLATGSTPLPVYQALADRIRDRDIDTRRVRGFALDEYIGLPQEHPQSYRSVLDREVVGPLRLTPDLVSVPEGDAHEIDRAGPRYEDLIRAAGGIDAQILGIGRTGHIGFNEPGSSLGSLTRVKTLAGETRADNARFFGEGESVPTHCITQGLGTILRARWLILLAFGAAKAGPVAAAVEGPLSASTPGSVIQLHPHATVLVDEEASRQLANADYYRYAWAARPSWQKVGGGIVPGTPAGPPHEARYTAEEGSTRPLMGAPRLLEMT